VRHGVVIGSGVSGLLAARALAAHCEMVTVLERDAIPESTAPRPGVPQGHHIHVMLAGGVRALERLFPGGVDELVRAGAQLFDYGSCRYHSLGDWMPCVHTGLPTLAATRPFFEHYIRQWIARMPNVRFQYGTVVSGPTIDGDRVTGVPGHPADLVIHATGRHSRLPSWLAAHGYPAPRRTEIGFDLGYATGRFRVPAAVLPEHPMVYVVGRPPQHTRVGVVIKLENGNVYGGMGGYQGDHPPGDPEGFLAFAKSLVHPDVHRVLAQSELLGPIVRFRIPNAVRHHYGRLRRFPIGILPIGDGICSYDPAFGHGMAAAALQAEALSECLAASPANLAREYFGRVEKIVDVPWNLCSGENLKYPGTRGPRTLFFPMTRRLKDRLVTRRDPAILPHFYSVVTLAAPPRVLLRSRTIRALL
jgi:2-polyprenyl-6-methoxyphenol hydroxylase-like FAD-dependent oxidoreductase